jgi:hypothetical protein
MDMGFFIEARALFIEAGERRQRVTIMQQWPRFCIANA